MGPSEVRLLPRLTLQRPPLHRTAEQARKLLGQSTAPSSIDVVAAVSDDPMAAACLMKRANGAYYGLGNHIDSLSHAIEVLGVQSTLRLLDGISGNEYHEPDSVVSRLYRHAGLTARLAHRIVSGKWPFDPECPSNPGTVFTAGLLHSLGRIVLAHSFPDESEALYRSSFVRADSDDGEWQMLERFQFGADHTELGELIARKLRLPDTLTRVVRRTGHTTSGSNQPNWIAAVDLARKIVDLEGYGVASPGSSDKLRQDDSWESLLLLDVVHPDELPLLVMELQAIAENTRTSRKRPQELTYASDRASRAVATTGTPRAGHPGLRTPERDSITTSSD